MSILRPKVKVLKRNMLMHMKSVFDLLDPRIKEILRESRIEKPTEPQAKSFLPLLQGRHVLLIAPTGLGKTESALLPIFHNFLKDKNSKKKGIKILYITPLRALNRDMLLRTFEWGKKLGIKVAVRHGDTSRAERARQAKNPPDMLITTPETLQILFIGKRLRKHLSTVKWVVVDEVHELASDERGAQLSVCLERLVELTRKEGHDFQRIGLSATVGLPSEVGRFLGGLENKRFREVTILEVDTTKRIDIKVEFPTIKREDYNFANRLSIDPVSFASLRRCKEIIDEHVSTLLFINTRDGAEILASRFHMWKSDKIGIHHGSLSKNARIESENDFKSGKIKGLICTSSLELGIDVGNTDFIIQYNSPREVTRIVQRIGRSGHRVGKVSRGLIISSNPEDLAESLVIARRALEGSLEQFEVRQNPLSVLSNQIIFITLEYGRITTNKVYEIFKRSYPFHRLSLEAFNSVLNQLRKQGSVWFEEENGEVYISKRMSSRFYFLDNISMIPDEKTFSVVDISTRKKIGLLDESFVLSSIFEGEKIILKGRPWLIVKIDNEEVLVSPAKEVGNVPSWVGEDIPVPFEVALEVGKLRRLISENKEINGYPCDKKTINRLFRYIKSQKEKGFVVPDDNIITIEQEDKSVVINACFGTKVNETLGRLISALLAQSLGESVGISSDPYRISLELPARMPIERVKDILLNTKPETLRYLIQTILGNSNYIRWHLVHVARKFGALKKDFDYKSIGIRRIIGIFENTPVLEESINKLIWERMDIKNTQLILKRIQEGEIKIIVQGLSPIATAGYEIRGLMVPQKADRTILMALKKRLEDSPVTLVCTNCFHSWNTRVERVGRQPKCSKCGAIRISAFRKYDKKSFKERELKRFLKNASLVLSYGRFALLALMARGIGPDTAARILRRYDRLDLERSEEWEMKFLRDILKAELTYARTRGFWDS